MYLSDLSSALSKNESIELSKNEIANIFQKQKHITISQRIALFHKLGLRGEKTQQEAADRMGISGSRSFVAQYDGLFRKLKYHPLWPSILDALSEDRLWEKGERRKKLDISALYRKLNKGDWPECVLCDEDGWHLR